MGTGLYSFFELLEQIFENMEKFLKQCEQNLKYMYDRFLEKGENENANVQII